MYVKNGHGKGNGKQGTVRATGLMLNWYFVQFEEFPIKFQNARYLCLDVAHGVATSERNVTLCLF